MKYRAIATDYDGTLATDGRVDDATLSALKRYQAAGGKLIMVTGRELTDLQRVFPPLAMFDVVVVENGAVLYEPSCDRIQLLAQPLPDSLVQTLVARDVGPIQRGKVIVATWQPHGETVQQTLRHLRLETELILNKQAVMILPQGINKASGLGVALSHLRLDPETVAGIGDAENDIDLLNACGFGIAVENALPSLKSLADWVTTEPRGAGVQELIQWILEG